MNKFMTITENILNFPFRHEEILIPLSVIFMTLYGTSNGFKLPVYMKNLIGNPFFRIFILSLIIYKRRSNPTMALFMSISFTLGMDILNKHSITEKFSTKDSQNESSNNTEIINSNEIIEDKIEDINIKSQKLDNILNNINNIDVTDSKQDSVLESNDIIQLLDSKKNIKESKNFDTNTGIRGDIPSKDLSTDFDQKIKSDQDNQKQKDDDFEEDDEPFVTGDTCNGLCQKISYKELAEKFKTDEFNQSYFDSIKDCMVVDLLKTKSDKEINSILKKLDLTHNDIDGPIGTAYVNYNDAVTRVNI